MKKLLLIIPGLILCFLMNFVQVCSLGAEEKKQNVKTISTTGEAKIWVEPDRARVYLGVETMRETIDAAREENAKNVKSVIEALKSLNIKGMLMKAPSYNVSLVKEYEHDATRQGRLPKIIGYKVAQDFTALLQNSDPSILSKDAAAAVDTALNNGVNIIQNIEFFKEDDSADRRKALENAVENAITNAKSIAKSAGVTIKEYQNINSTIGYWRQPFVTNVQMQRPDLGAGMAGEATTLIAGKIAVTSNVSISCIIE